jgi:two-component system LytT family response regulator
MQKLSAIIVDDEDLARENLRMLLEEHCPEIDVVGLAGGVRQARELIHEKKTQSCFPGYPHALGFRRI